jgi:hypothetical protein
LEHSWFWAEIRKTPRFSNDEKTDNIDGVVVPGIEKPKQIAQDDLVYGLSRL